jgi:predicted ATPase/transcriptional regulator with XRE-family HTH domain
MHVSHELLSFDRTDIHQLRDFLLNQRKLSGWTQEELSERSGVSVRTIRNLETGFNTNPRRTSVALLLTAFGATAEALADNASWAGGNWTAPVLSEQRTESPRGASTMLPPWHGPWPLGDPLVGRRAELRHVLAAAQRSRLVVLTGPGGVGKTRLALTAASRLHPLFREGVTVAELHDIPPEHLEPERAGAEFARILAEFTGGAGRPGGGRKLLVLDGAEHVAQQAARAARQLLDQHPAVHVLVTSRRTLAVGAAEIFEVEPLRVDDRDAAVPGAVELLLRRTQAGLPNLDLGSRLPLVTRLCRLLDGLPLALEIAAQRLRSLPLTSLLNEQTLFHLLDHVDAGGLSVHRTLSDNVRWSYELLPEPHRELMHDLVALPDTFSLEDAAAARPGRQTETILVAHLLAELADASLVQIRRGRQYTYRIHTLVRHVVSRIEQSGAPAGPAHRIPVSAGSR